MARTANINANINTKQGVKGMNQLNKTIKSTEKTTFNLQSELRKMKEELALMDTGTAEFEEMSRAAGDLQDRVDNVTARVKVFASDTLALDQTVGVVQGVAGAYSMVQGAVALAGVENEKLMEVMVKLQAIQATINGLQQVSNVLQKEHATGILLRTTRTKALNAVQAVQQALMVKSIPTTHALNTAMRALPIVAIIGGIAALTTAYIKWNNASNEAAEETERLKEEQEELEQKQKEMTKGIAEQSGEFVGLINQLRNTNQNSKERVKLMEDINKTYGTTLKNLKDETQFQEQLNLAIEDYIDLQRNKFIMAANQERINELLQEEIELQRQLGIDNERVMQRLTQSGMDSMQILTMTNEEIRAMDDGYDRTSKSIENVRAELSKLGLTQLELSTDIEDGSPANTPSVPSIDNGIKANQAYWDAIEKDRISRLESALEKELQAEADNFDNLIRLAEEAGEDTAELTTQYQDRITQIYKTYQAEQDAIKQEGINNEIKLNNEVAILTEQLLQKRLVANADTEEQKEEIIKQSNAKLLELQQKQLDDERDIILQNTELTEKEREKIKLQYALKQEQLLEDFNSEDLDEVKEWGENFKDIMQDVSQTVSATFGAMSDVMFSTMNLQAVNLQNNLNQLDRQFARKQEELQSLLADREIGEEEFNARMIVLEEETAREETRLRREQFDRDKRMKIAMAGMNVAAAVTQALASSPPPASFALAGITAASGAIQIAAINREEFRAAQGGIVPGGESRRDSVNALLAPGEAVINSQSTRMFAPILSAINEAGGGNQLVPGVDLENSMESTFKQNKEEHNITVDARVVRSEMTKEQNKEERIKRANVLR